MTNHRHVRSERCDRVAVPVPQQALVAPSGTARKWLPAPTLQTSSSTPPRSMCVLRGCLGARQGNRRGTQSCGGAAAE